MPELTFDERGIVVSREPRDGTYGQRHSVGSAPSATTAAGPTDGVESHDANADDLSQVKCVMLLPEFFERVAGRHRTATLIWGPECVSELSRCLLSEVAALDAACLEAASGPPAVQRAGAATDTTAGDDERGVAIVAVPGRMGALDGNTVAWNHLDFEVPYVCLQSEIKVGAYYLRLLLNDQFAMSPVDNARRASKAGDDAGETTSPGAVQKAVIDNPSEFLLNAFFRVSSDNVRRTQLLTLHVMVQVLRCYGGQLQSLSFLPSLLQLAAPGSELARASEAEPTDGADDDAAWALAVRGKILDVVLEALSLTVGGASGPRNAAGKANQRRFVLSGGVGVVVRTLASLRDSVQRQVAASRMARLRSEDAADDREVARENRAPGALASQVLTSDKDWFEAQRMGPDDVALACLSVLTLLVRSCPALEPTFRTVAVLSPVPAIKQELCSDLVLPLLVSMAGAQHEELTQRTVGLLRTLLQFNSAVVPTLYRTGLFLHLLQYPGDDLLPIAQLLNQLHLEQESAAQHLSASCMAQPTPPAALAQPGAAISRSVLTPLLPACMVMQLVRHGPEGFARAFAADASDPDVIWSQDMRASLRAHITALLAERREALGEGVPLTFDDPIQPMDYGRSSDLQQLQCHNYFVKQLLDEERFPHWPIPSPGPFLAALVTALDGWAAGRFDAAGSEAGGGIGPEQATLLVRTMCLLFRRFPETPQCTKFEGFSAAMRSIERALEGGGARAAAGEESSEGVRDRGGGLDGANRSLLREVLCLLSVATASGSNDGESNSVACAKAGAAPAIKAVLEAVLGPGVHVRHATPRVAPSLRATTRFALSALATTCGLPSDLSPQAPPASGEAGLRSVAVEAPSIVSHVLSLLRMEVPSSVLQAGDSGGAKSGAGLRATATDMEELDIAAAALSCIAAFADAGAHQDSEVLIGRMADQGVAWHILPFCITCDHEEAKALADAEAGMSAWQASASESNEVSPLATALQSVSAPSRRAYHAARAVLLLLGGTTGPDDGVHATSGSRDVLTSLITVGLAQILKVDGPAAFLAKFTGDVQLPMVLWTAETRKELRTMLAERLSSGNHDLAPGFEFAAHARELRLGEPCVFVRCFNTDPSAVSSLPDVPAFLDTLLTALQAHVDAVKIRGPNEAWRRSQEMAAVLEATHGVVRNQAGMPERLLAANRFPLLFSVLAPQVREITSDLIAEPLEQSLIPALPRALSACSAVLGRPGAPATRHPLPVRLRRPPALHRCHRNGSCHLHPVPFHQARGTRQGEVSRTDPNPPTAAAAAAAICSQFT